MISSPCNEQGSSPHRRKIILSIAASVIVASHIRNCPASAAEPEPMISIGPFSTRRQYKTITLAPNGLRVLLVSDKMAFRASAALSIQGAGQFAEPPEVPGLAHLMEHMTLSTNPSSKQQEFEEWLSDREGASNAFTAPGLVCFHFNCPPGVFPDTLQRFASMLDQEAVLHTCQNQQATLQREIRRVDSELDYSSDATQAFYLVKDMVSPQHPFSRWGAGSVETLEHTPREQGIQVETQLAEFFQQRYLPTHSVLVVVGPFDVSYMERWVSPFATALSRREPERTVPLIEFPDPFPNRSRLVQLVLYRSKVDPTLTENVQKLTMEWALQLDYERSRREGTPIITAPTVGFVISQILSRRGPGSLYLFLFRRGWVPRGNQGLPRITFPVDVSGFQMMKLEIGLTLDGFANRSAVVAAVYDSIRVVSRVSQSSFLLPLEVLKQYVIIATLHGYVLAPRPPDAVELAIDAQTFGFGDIGVPNAWPIVPSPDDIGAMNELRQVVSDILTVMNDPTKAIVIITASPKAILSSRFSIVDEALPPISSPRWQVADTSGARYYPEMMLKFPGYLQEWVAAKLDEDELLPPVINPLIPTKLRPARAIKEVITMDGSRRLFYLDSPDDGRNLSDSRQQWREFLTQSPNGPVGSDTTWEERALISYIGADWKLWQTPTISIDLPKLPLPMMSSEPSCRCAFVLQLLSAQPARANVKQAAHAQLWLISFENAISDLAELGAPAGLAYDLSFNKFGLRICFLGISQNLSSYARRFCRRLVEHHSRLMQGPNMFDPSIVGLAVADASRTMSVYPLRKRQIIGLLRDSTPTDAAQEGMFLLKSCSGGVCLAQGDLLPKEAIGLLNDIKDIFHGVIAQDISQLPAIPEITEVLYNPFWKPRSASPCLIPGVPLISDACGRIQR